MATDAEGEPGAETFSGNERQLSLILNNVSDVIFAIAVEGDGRFRFTSVNQRFLEATGLAEGQVVGALVRDVIPEVAHALVFAKYREAMESGRPVHWEEVSEYPAGRKVGHVTLVPLSDASGRCTQLIGLVHDISALKQSEERLAESERKYRDLVERANSIILRWTRDGRVAFLNEFGQRFFGYSSEEIVGQHVMGTIVPASESSGRDLRRLMDEICSNPVAFEQNVNENVKRNGERVWIAWTNRIVKDAAGEITEILSIGSDITDRKAAEEQVRRLNEDLRRHTEQLEQRVAERTAELAIAKDRAEAADRTKSAFLATMSHELRTPLNSIIGFTGLLLQEMAGPLSDEQAVQLRMVRDSGRHLLALINDVLDISKIEAGQIEIAQAPFDLRESVERTIETVRPLADKKQVPILARIPDRLEPVTSDRRRVEQILLNLLSNAVKFTETGHVGITVRETADTLSVAVTDTGCGIRTEDLDKLFQPFRQLDTGLSRHHEGTGLGLAICRRLVERLGGAISVASEPGKGSTFSFTLPRDGA